MPLDPKSVQIAGVATATIVAFGLAVASATKTEPTVQHDVSSRVSPGAADIEETETQDPPTPTPTPTATSTASKSDNDDSGDHDNDNDDDGDNRDDEVNDAWIRRVKQNAERREEAREKWEKFVHDAKKQRAKQLEKRRDEWRKLQKVRQKNNGGPFGHDH